MSALAHAQPVRARRSFLRTGVLVAIASILLMVVFGTVGTLLAQKRLIERESSINTWFLAQTEIEYLRLTNELAAFAAKPQAGAEEVGLRFEIFWSRLNVLDTGEQSAQLRRIDGVNETLDGLLAGLRDLEAPVAALGQADAAAVEAVRARLAGFAGPLHEMVQRGTLTDSGLRDADRERLSALFYVALGLFAAILGGIVLLFVLLFRQMAKTATLFMQAAGAERAAQVAQAQLVEAIDSVSEGFVLFDREDRVVLFNQNYRGLYAAAGDVLAVGGRFEDVVRAIAAGGGYRLPEDAEAWLRQRLAHHRDPKRALDCQLGDGRWVRVSERRTEDGRLVGVHTDITDRVLAEEERERLLEQFHAAQKMQAIGTLAGGIAHDFNNILASIIGYCLMLLEDTPADDPNHMPLEQMLKAGERAKELVRQILTYSRNQEFDLQPVDLSALCDDGLELLRSGIPANIRVLRGAAEPAPIRADPAQVHQIVQNFVINAVHAIGEGEGTISVEVGPAIPPVEPRRGGGAEPADAQAFWSAQDGETARLRVGAFEARPYTRLRVADTGCGMSRATMMRIFEPFFTTKEVGRGTGLGLAAVLGIARNHGAVICVESVVGGGTTFEVWFACAAAAESRPPAAKLAGPAPGRGRILLVDDDETLLEMSRRTLVRYGYDVDAVSGGAEALALFAADPAAWSVAITDRTMPGMDGEELARRLVALRADLPVVMCTGFGDREAESRARAAGVREFLMKPVVGRELAEVVARAIAASAVNQPARNVA